LCKDYKYILRAYYKYLFINVFQRIYRSDVKTINMENVVDRENISNSGRVTRG
jgi:hypothetical protein